MGLLGFDNFADAFDGGGAGKSGDTFSGGPLSELLNALGIRPAGFGAREMGPRPMANPAYSQPRISTSGPMAPPMGYGGRPDVPVGGGMPAARPTTYIAGRPETPAPTGLPASPLTPDQVAQLLQILGTAPQGPVGPMSQGLSAPSEIERYLMSLNQRPAMIPPTSLGYGPR